MAARLSSPRMDAGDLRGELVKHGFNSGTVVSGLSLQSVLTELWTFWKACSCNALAFGMTRSKCVGCRQSADSTPWFLKGADIES